MQAEQSGQDLAPTLIVFPAVWAFWQAVLIAALAGASAAIPNQAANEKTPSRMPHTARRLRPLLI